MVLRTVVYTGAMTAGTALTAATTGFTVPQGFAGIISIAKGGEKGDSVDVTFPGSQHRFGLEQVPVIASLGEVATETRIISSLTDLPGTPCYWKLPPGTDITITPRGVEGGETCHLYVTYGTADEFGKHPPIHWTREDYTTGTTADNDLLMEVQGCRAIQYALTHAANVEYVGIRTSRGGDVYTIVGYESAGVGTKQDPIRPQRLGIPVPSTARVYWAEDAAGYGAAGTGPLYVGWVY